MKKNTPDLPVGCPFGGANRRAGEQIHGEFTSDEFAGTLIGRVGYLIFHWRRALLLVGVLVTAVLGYCAFQLQITAGFAKMVPTNHEYMRTFADYQGDFGGADKVLVAIKVKDGTLFQPAVMETVRKITEDMFYVKGVERSSLTSLFTSNVRYNEVVEEGFKSGNIVPADFSGKPDEMENVRKNILKSDWVGRIVSPSRSRSCPSCSTSG